MDSHLYLCVFMFCVFSFSSFFLFFFIALMNSNWHCSCTWLYCAGDKVTVHALFMHCPWNPQPLYSKKIFKLGPTTLFTHLKIILLQCFQFSIFSKISYIQMDPKYCTLAGTTTEIICVLSSRGHGSHYFFYHFSLLW